MDADHVIKLVTYLGVPLVLLFGICWWLYRHAWPEWKQQMELHATVLQQQRTEFLQCLVNQDVNCRSECKEVRDKLFEALVRRDELTEIHNAAFQKEIRALHDVVLKAALPPRKRKTQGA